ncbi:MAG: hypothetical protein QNJ45_15025 [Ardenticatenaceae bacterium]|nr:hypothetical protein [Ardenticatenaceae bacterium]
MTNENSAKQYVVELGSSMVAYTIILFVAIYFLQPPGNELWRIPVALLPVIPLFFALRAVMRFITKMDELQQRIQFQSITFAAITTGFITFSWGMLENANIPPLPLVWVFPIMIGLWGVSQAYFSRRYS